MRTLKHITTVLILLSTITAIAQQGINYKALIKDGNGNVIANDLIIVQFQILQGAGMTNVYQETHTPTTDANGLIMVNISEGTTSDVFTAIDWGADDHYLNVQINTGSGLTDMGTTQFMAVPYALSAANAATKINDLSDGKSDADGSSLFLGKDAGLNDDGTGNLNVGVGFEALYSNTTGDRNTATGYAALTFNTTGDYNTANGFYALHDNTTGDYNTANGFYALHDNTIGNDNTATGSFALRDNTTGYYNTANGYYALGNNTIGAYNTANGYYALRDNTTGTYNTANGYYALRDNTTGNSNTANGSYALSSNDTGNSNIATGYEALTHNTTGNSNTATGDFALRDNTTGSYNTANGYLALYSNSTGRYNTAVGFEALYNATLHNNTAIGRQALKNVTTGSNNIGVGYDAQVPNPTLNNQVRIGNANIQSATTQVAWTFPSDKRWKEKIRELPYGIEVVKQLKPVDYMRKNNDARTRDMGFIAQDVEALLTKIGYKDQGFLTKDGNGYLSIRYNDFIALLTKAIQEQQEIIESQNNEIKSLSAVLIKSEKENIIQNKNIEQLVIRMQQLEATNNQ